MRFLVVGAWAGDLAADEAAPNSTIEAEPCTHVEFGTEQASLEEVVSDRARLRFTTSNAEAIRPESNFSAQSRIMILAFDRDLPDRVPKISAPLCFPSEAPILVGEIRQVSPNGSRLSWGGLLRSQRPRRDES